jgi:hypothetical protein
MIPGYRPENVPKFKLIESNEGDVFISLNKLNEECVDKIKTEIRNKESIEEYIETFKKPISTTYEKKKPTRLQIDSDSQDNTNVIKKKPLIIEENVSSPEEYTLKPNKKQINRNKTNKKVIIKSNKKTRKNKNKKLLIIESSSTENV